MAGRIRCGVGGWTFEPWRGVFFPQGTPHSKELAYASRHLTAIEINGTYYSTQKPQTFAKWAEATPDDFVFTVKASRFCTNRKILADSGDSVARFMSQGLSELGEKLGPILWQFMPTKKFDPEDFAAFLNLLPQTLGSHRLRHALEVRHESFADPAFIALARKAQAAVVFALHDTYPAIADLTSDFVYARLQTAKTAFEAGYPDAALDRWAKVAKSWSKGLQPQGLRRVSDIDAPKTPRDTFIFMISGDKVRNPAAAKAFLERI